MYGRRGVGGVGGGAPGRGSTGVPGYGMDNVQMANLPPLRTPNAPVPTKTPYNPSFSRPPLPDLPPPNSPGPADPSAFSREASLPRGLADRVPAQARFPHTQRPLPGLGGGGSAAYGSSASLHSDQSETFEPRVSGAARSAFAAEDVRDSRAGSGRGGSFFGRFRRASAAPGRGDIGADPRRSRADDWDGMEIADYDSPMPGEAFDSVRNRNPGRRLKKMAGVPLSESSRFEARGSSSSASSSSSPSTSTSHYPNPRSLSFPALLRAVLSAQTWRNIGRRGGGGGGGGGGGRDLSRRDSKSRVGSQRGARPGSASTPMTPRRGGSAGAGAGTAVKKPNDSGGDLDDWRGGSPDVDARDLVPSHVLDAAKERHKGTVTNSIFISYCHADAPFVRRLVAALKASGIDPWVDWEDIPVSSDWWREIELSIDGADTVINILSPAYLASYNCGREVAYAAEKGKAMVPVVIEPVVIADVPKVLAALNFLFWSATDPFTEKYELLLEAIEANYDDKRFHTVLLSRALMWSAKREAEEAEGDFGVDRGKASGGSESILLRGDELEDAEAWVERVLQSQYAVSPSPLHFEFVRASRAAVIAAREEHAQRTRRRMILFLALLVLSGVCLLGSIVTTVFAFQQKNRADAATAKAEEATLNSHRSRLIDSLTAVGLAAGLAEIFPEITVAAALYAYEALSVISIGSEYGEAGSMTTGALEEASKLEAWTDLGGTAAFLDPATLSYDGIVSQQNRIASGAVSAVNAGVAVTGILESGLNAMLERGFILALGNSRPPTASASSASSKAALATPFAIHIGVGGAATLVGPLPSPESADPYLADPTLFSGGVLATIPGTGVLEDCRVSSSGATVLCKGVNNRREPTAATLVEIEVAESMVSPSMDTSTTAPPPEMTASAAIEAGLVTVTRTLISNTAFTPVRLGTVSAPAAFTYLWTGASEDESTLGTAGSSSGGGDSSSGAFDVVCEGQGPSRSLQSVAVLADLAAGVHMSGYFWALGAAASDRPYIALWESRADVSNGAALRYTMPEGFIATAYTAAGSYLVVAAEVPPSTTAAGTYATQRSILVVDLSDGLDVALASEAAAAQRTVNATAAMNDGDGDDDVGEVHGIYFLPGETSRFAVFGSGTSAPVFEVKRGVGEGSAPVATRRVSFSVAPDTSLSHSVARNQYVVTTSGQAIAQVFEIVVDEDTLDPELRYVTREIAPSHAPFSYSSFDPGRGLWSSHCGTVRVWPATEFHRSVHNHVCAMAAVFSIADITMDSISSIIGDGAGWYFTPCLASGEQ